MNYKKAFFLSPVINRQEGALFLTRKARKRTGRATWQMHFDN